MKSFLLLSIGPTGDTEARGMYASKAAASRQINKNLCSVERVWHLGAWYAAREITYRIVEVK